MSASQSGSSTAAKLRSVGRCARWSMAPLALGLASILGSACGIRADSLDGSSLDTTSDTTKVKVQVQAMLRELFPNLTDDEVEQLSVNLSLEAAAALEVEITDMRAVASELSRDLSDAASAAAKQRKSDLSSRNDGFPTGLEPLGRSAFYDGARGEARIDLSGVFSDHTPVTLANGELSVSLAGTAQTTQLSCANSEPVDIVFLVDVTGSMSPVIGAVQRSLQKFVAGTRMTPLQASPELPVGL